MIKIIKYILIYLSLITLHSSAMDTSDHETTIRQYPLISIGYVPRYYAQLATTLSQQPFFKGQGALAKMSKVLPLENLEDCRISEILNHNATGYGSPYFIRAFAANNRLLSSSGESIKRGLILSFYEDTLDLPQDLEKTYAGFIETLKDGWSVERLYHNSTDILYEHDIESKREEALFFIKEKKLVQEELLLQFLAKKFNLEDKMGCGRAWFKQSTGLQQQEFMYLWVTWVALEEIKSTLKLKIN